MVSTRCATWTLLSLVLAGAVVALVVLLVLQPKQTESVVVEVNGTLPLDAVFVLDASLSVHDTPARPDWERALNFTRSMALHLNRSLSQFQAGLSQFSDKYHDGFPMGSDLEHFAQLPRGFSKIGGLTYTDKGLCGNAAQDFESSCSGGAYGILAAAPPPPKSSAAVDCGAGNASQLIILVADGRANDGTKATAAAKYIKQNSAVKLMAVLVGQVQGGSDELYALSSCCPPEEMVAMKVNIGTHPRCKAPRNDSCPYMVTTTDYAALVRSAEQLVSTITANMECTGTSETSSFHVDYRALWLLLLLAPLMVYVAWKRLLLLLSRSHREQLAYSEGDHTTPAIPPTPAVEMTTDPQPATAPGRKWAPVRSAYIVGGRRMDVDFGSSCPAPPTAPNAARRGGDQEAANDTPEAFFASQPLDQQADIPLLGVADAQIAPNLQRVNCGIVLPLVFTLALLPVAVHMSGILEVLGLE